MARRTKPSAPALSTTEDVLAALKPRTRTASKGGLRLCFVQPGVKDIDGYMRACLAANAAAEEDRYEHMIAAYAAAYSAALPTIDLMPAQWREFALANMGGPFMEALVDVLGVSQPDEGETDAPPFS